jgi:hypothetical protein
MYFEHTGFPVNLPMLPVAGIVPPGELDGFSESNDRYDK